MSFERVKVSGVSLCALGFGLPLLFLFSGGIVCSNLGGESLSWQDEASLRTDGLLYRLRRRVEHSAPAPTVRDEQGKVYRLDPAGIFYDPHDDNWGPSIPSTNEAPLVLARARGLLRSGAMEAGLEDLLALQVMDGRFFPVSEAARNAAREASSLIHELTISRQTLPSLIQDHDPFALYDAAGNSTWIISETASFRVALAGRFRMRRGKSYQSNGSRNRIVHLTNGTDFLMLSLDLWPDPNFSLSRENYLGLMDLRRGLDRARQESTDFARVCREDLCSCRYTEKGSRKEWLEAAKTRKGAAFFFAVYPSNERLLRLIMDRVVGDK